MTTPAAVLPSLPDVHHRSIAHRFPTPPRAPGIAEANGGVCVTFYVTAAVLAAEVPRRAMIRRLRNYALDRWHYEHPAAPAGLRVRFFIGRDASLPDGPTLCLSAVVLPREARP